MRTDFLDYDLPSHLIAQEPAAQRDASRLLIMRRADRSLEHRSFRDLPELLAPGDLLVLNDTRVVPARLVGQRERTGGKWEGLFLRAAPDGTWELLCQTRGRLLEGETVLVEPGPLRLTVLRQQDGHWLVRPKTMGPALELLERHGRVPLPAYIRKGQARDDDRDRYQTVYARRAGAVAAPTAGLHFTPEIFARLDERGIGRAFVTLHVGIGTFQPIKTEDVSQHRMHREWGELPAATAATIADCKSRGGRVVAVGTTTVRVLETAAAAASGPVWPWCGETELFIYSPYPFRCVDALVTNFHLPRSTLLLLVAAFAGVELTRQAYQTAVDHQYRFFSYGDAMLIL
ncbi:MAG: tRNA preQ1(34) S-adenosylmethionine ribosyltransferase-isomerase QueA [Planctomycetes bacterium]|nr:tRNA preQ1(34) S-adenosylmethionine ribosyltransferase-isomerase QueA [Planctomycetota bacterium]